MSTTECPGETSLRMVTFQLKDASDSKCYGVKDIAYNSDGRFVLTFTDNSKKIIPSCYVLVEDSAPDQAASTLSVELATPRGEVLLLSRAVTDEEVTFLVFCDGGVYKLREENTGCWLLTDDLTVEHTLLKPWPTDIYELTMSGIGDETLNALAKFLSANSCFKY